MLGPNAGGAAPLSAGVSVAFKIIGSKSVKSGGILAFSEGPFPALP